MTWRFFARTVALSTVAATLTFGTPAGEIVQHHSMSPPFIDDWWQEGVPHWDIGGDAVVTSKFVRLTPQKQSRFGWAWNSQRNEIPWWEVRVHVKVRSVNNNGADGIGLWYVEAPYKNDKPGPLFGMERTFKGVGVLLDSYDNDNRRDNPSVMFINNIDGATNEWDDQEDFSNTAQFKCQMDYRSVIGAGEAGLESSGVVVTIQYVHRTLTVRLRNVAGHEEVYCGDAQNIDLPMNWVWGLTATTGGLADNHDITRFEVRPLGDAIGNRHNPVYEPGMHNELTHTTHHDQTPSPSQQKPDTHFDHDHDEREKTYWADKKDGGDDTTERETQRHISDEHATLKRDSGSHKLQSPDPTI